MVEAYVRMLGNAGRFDEAKTVLGEYANAGLTHPLVDAVKPAIEQGKRPGLFAENVQVGAAEMFHGVGMALARDGGLDLAMMFLAARASPQSVRRLHPDLDRPAARCHRAATRRPTRSTRRIPETSPMKPIATVRIAQNLDAMGEHDEAIRRLNEITAAHPDDLDALSILGDILRGEEEYLPSIDAYTKALALTGGENQSDWRFYYVRGIAYERAKIWDKAEDDFLKALELNPDQPQVLNYLGYTWVDQGQHLQQALEMIEKAVAAAPNDGYIIDSLGWAFYRLGRFEEAVGVLEQAVQTAAQRSRDQRPSRRRLLARRPQARSALPVERRLRPSTTSATSRSASRPSSPAVSTPCPVSPDSAPIDDPAAATNAEATP